MAIGETWQAESAPQIEPTRGKALYPQVPFFSPSWCWGQARMGRGQGRGQYQSPEGTAKEASGWRHRLVRANMHVLLYIAECLLIKCHHQVLLVGRFD